MGGVLMKENDNNLFPGLSIGTIQIFIKQSEGDTEESVQLRFDWESNETIKCKSKL